MNPGLTLYIYVCIYIYKIGIYFKTYVGYQLHMWGITMISVGIWIIQKSDLWRLEGITA